MNKISLILIFVSLAFMGSDDWLIGKFRFGFDMNKSTGIYRETGEFEVIKDNGQYWAVNKNSRALVSFVEINEENFERIFGIPFQPHTKVKCAQLAATLVCKTNQDINLKDNNVFIKKGYFGMVPDAGIMMIKKLETR